MASTVSTPISDSDYQSQSSGDEASIAEAKYYTRLFHYSCVSDEDNALMFRAAASHQIIEQSSILATISKSESSTHQAPRNGCPTQDILLSNDELVTSPYREPGHLLNLISLDDQDRLIALALTFLKPARDDYAVGSYETALNWTDVMSALKYLVQHEHRRWRKHSFLVVYFRSQLKQTIDTDLLFKLDKESHGEATTSGGLLKYWFGTPGTDRRNLATCLWRSKEDAIQGGKGQWHRQARGAAARFFENIDFGRLSLTIEDDVSDWNFTPVVD